jgi:Arm domain-containing DNA-binding protein
MRLTKREIDRLKHTGTDGGPVTHWDAALPGFGLRVYASGTKTFVLSYRADGRKRLITLGGYGTLTLEQARSKALREKARILDGGDPLETRQQNRAAKTMAALSESYLSRTAAHKKSGDADARRIRSWILPKWGNRLIKSLRRDEIAAEHAEIGERIGRYEANRRLALLRRMLNLTRNQVLRRMDFALSRPPHY